jgi:hypothetical protein
MKPSVLGATHATVQSLYNGAWKLLHSEQDGKNENPTGSV